MQTFLCHINKSLLLLLFSLLLPNLASATIYRFSFTNNSTEFIEVGANGATNPPAGIFAYLDFDTSINQFRVYDGPNNYLGASMAQQGVGLGINGIAFNFDSNLPTLGSVSYPTTGPSVFYDIGSMLGLTSISVPNAINNNFDVAYKALENGNEVITDTYKLIGGESETFEISGFTASSLNLLNGATNLNNNLTLQASSIAVRVQTSTGNSASWFSASAVSAVPEANSLEMMLAGLGLISIFVRRDRFQYCSNK